MRRADSIEMWDFAGDLKRWDAIAWEAHTRHSREQVSSYVALLSGVEATAHRHVARAAAEKQRVLEIGVGGGEHLAFAPDQRRHQFYIGIDINVGFAKICHEKYGTSVVGADVAALPFADASFDCVIAMNVFEHVQPLDRSLSEVARVLEPGGTLHVVVPTNGSLAVNAFKLLVTYPTMRRARIARPDLVWHYLNVNGYKRICVALARHFRIESHCGLPLKFLHWHLSPMWAFACRKKPDISDD